MMFNEENDKDFEFTMNLKWESEDLGFGLGPYDLRYANADQTQLIARDVIYPDKKYQVLIGAHQIEILYGQFLEFITKYNRYYSFETFIIDLTLRRENLDDYVKF